MKEFAKRPDLYDGMGSLNVLSEQMMTILYHGIIHPDHKVAREGGFKE